MKIKSKPSFRAGRLLGACAVIGLATGTSAYAQDCYDDTDLQLVNGNIHTMDAEFSVVSAVRVANGRIVSVGKSAPGPCTRVIDLDGRTVIPGLIDNHVHLLLTFIRPGHETRAVENARNVADVQDAIRARAAGVPKGEFITTIGGIASRQFAENRLPTLEELDEAAPNHPVFLLELFNGPSATNSLGKVFLESQGIAVSATGVIAGGKVMGAGAKTATNPSHDAFQALDTLWDLDHRKQTAQAVMDYATSFGLTTAHTVGGSQGRGPGYFDPAIDHEVILSLLQEDKINMRLRIYYNAYRSALDDIMNNIFPHFGGDLIKTAGIGEHILTFGLDDAVPLGQDYIDRATKIAQNGWQLMEHSLVESNVKARADAWSIVNKTASIADLRWSTDHVYTIELETMNRLNALGASLRLHTTRRYMDGTAGPPFRKILDNLVHKGKTIHVGVGSDAAQRGPINPWKNIYYIVSGRDVTGELVNDGQQATRQEAIWMYTAANGWFSKEEDDLGSIEVGKFGDLVVLNNDFFDEDEVSEEGIKDIASVLTIVGGRIVHDAGVLD